MNMSIVRTATAVVLTGLALQGCSLGNVSAAGDSQGSAGFAVPSGVVKQYEVLAEELEENGQSVESGGWTVSLITEAAEPWHTVDHGGHSEYRAPAAGETDHIEIIPIETATGRIVPDVPISLEVVGADGELVEQHDLAFYYSTFFHYADNFSIPQAGDYTLRATVGVPTFNRHGSADEAPPMTQPTTVEFAHVRLGADTAE